MTKPPHVPQVYYRNLAASIHLPQAYKRRIGWREAVTIVIAVIVAACWIVAAAGDAVTAAKGL